MSSTTKVVLVTGCSKGGIGYSLCKEFASKGCKVYATARRPEAMEGLDDEIERLQLDVTNDAKVQEVVKTVVEREGRIDIAVNNAGMMCHKPVADVSVEEMANVFNTNTFSVVRVAKAVIPHMAARRSGTIVQMGSLTGDLSTPWSGPYAASKAAMHSLSETLYMECLPFNISVMLISAGGVKSNISKEYVARYELPPNSLYIPWLDAILARLSSNKRSRVGSMPTDEFAKRVVDAAVSPHPPQYMTLAPPARLWAFFRWLPRTWVLRFLWRVVGGKPKSKTD